ncbi:hypothetical protein MRB53_038897 [Persea americana]|nr:hypothetical protein MRB53_038897 [Persea americana]
MVASRSCLYEHGLQVVPDAFITRLLLSCLLISASRMRSWSAACSAFSLCNDSSISICSFNSRSRALRACNSPSLIRAEVTAVAAEDEPGPEVETMRQYSLVVLGLSLYDQLEYGARNATAHMHRSVPQGVF